MFALPRRGFEEEKFGGDEGVGAKSCDLRIIVAAVGLSVVASGHIPVRRRYGNIQLGLKCRNISLNLPLVLPFFLPQQKVENDGMTRS